MRQADARPDLTAPARLDCDVVVAGAGLGGVVAAVRAAEDGRRVILLDPRSQTGGTAMYSGGGVHIWGAPTWDAYRRHCPLADPVLARTLFDNYPRLVAWLQATGAPGRYATTANRGLILTKYQLGSSIAAPGRRAWFDHMGRRLERLGGRTLLRAAACRLVVEDGAVVGLEAEQAGRRLHIRASSIVLATGGFQNNAEMLIRYIGPQAGAFVNRGAEENRGDGLRMALEAGAAHTDRMDTLYGHLMPAPPCRPDPREPMDLLLLSAFYAEHAIVVNTAGRRFVDEGAGELNGETINAAARQRGDLWLVIDSDIRERFARYELPSDVMRLDNIRHAALARYMRLRRSEGGLAVTLDSLRFAQDRGALLLMSDTLTGLAAQMAAHGVDAAGLISTVQTFNAKVEGDQAMDLDIPKTKSAHRLQKAPFYAIKVAVGVSMTYGGVRIDSAARALNAAGRPMPGLFAVPGAAGGVHHLHYAGALAACAVFGMIAAETIAGRQPADGSAPR